MNTDFRPPAAPMITVMGRPTISSTQRIALFVATALLGAALLTPTIGATSPGAIAAKKGKKRLKPITGKLSKRDYTVIALAENGKAATVQVKGHRFRLRPPAPQVTLHLRAPDGTYAGPVVLGRASGGNGKASATGKKGKRARGSVVVGVEAGANLGKIGVHPGKGYAKVRKQPRKFVDAELVARATKKGVPIGNGLNVGLVRSKAKGHGSDPDLDGVPNSLDIDDDGDLILDSYDTPGQARGSRDATRSLDSPSATPFMDAFTSLFAGGADAVNVNGGSSDQQIDASVQNHAQLGILWGGVDPGSAELNCGALIYCRSGGTGRYAPIGSTPIADTQPFPACCDPDHDGFGSLPEHTQPSRLRLSRHENLHRRHGRSGARRRCRDRAGHPRRLTRGTGLLVGVRVLHLPRSRRLRRRAGELRNVHLPTCGGGNTGPRRPERRRRGSVEVLATPAPTCRGRSGRGRMDGRRAPDLHDGVQRANGPVLPHKRVPGFQLLGCRSEPQPAAISGDGTTCYHRTSPGPTSTTSQPISRRTPPTPSASRST